MKITFETTLEQFKKVYLTWIISHVSTENIYSLTTDDLTVTMSNSDVEVTVDKIVVTCDLPESSEEDSTEPSESTEPIEPTEPSENEGEGGEE